MKTNIYNKAEHTEGYVGSGNEQEGNKSAVQKAYEERNEGNEVTSFGKEKTNDSAKQNFNARDGYDNSGTQGYDSLSDDAYNSTDKTPSVQSAESHTGSSSKDFKKSEKNIHKRNEDDALNTGI